MKTNQIIAMGAVLAGIGVIAGAFGAHLLENRLSQDQMGAYETAVFYQLFHALVLIVLGVIYSRYSIPKFLYLLFLLGILFFSGSIYLLVLAHGSALAKIAGPITPVGGSLLIIGWLILAYHLWKHRQPID